MTACLQNGRHAKSFLGYVGLGPGVNFCLACGNAISENCNKKKIVLLLKYSSG